MNKIVAAIVCAASVAVVNAETNESVTAEAVMVEAMKVIQKEGWTAADVADAIKSVRELYVRDNSTTDGRKRWNGPVVETRVDTNAMTKTTIHENGRVFVDAAKVTTPAESVSASNAKLRKATVTTNGIPAKLVEARLRRQQESTTVSNITIEVTAGR